MKTYGQKVHPKDGRLVFPKAKNPWGLVGDASQRRRSTPRSIIYPLKTTNQNLRPLYVIHEVGTNIHDKMKTRSFFTQVSVFS